MTTTLESIIYQRNYLYNCLEEVGDEGQSLFVNIIETDKFYNDFSEGYVSTEVKIRMLEMGIMYAYEYRNRIVLVVPDDLQRIYWSIDWEELFYRNGNTDKEPEL